MIATTMKPGARRLVLGMAAAALAATSLATADDYYKGEPQFHMWPDPGGARYKISHFGPTGIGLELRQPAFTMHIVNIEEGSPAAATGELKPGQIIESVNGKVLKEEDPRVLLGNWITEAEAADGVMKMMVKDGPDATAREVIVKIPALGAYSETWPVDCEKTDKIIRNHAEALAAHIDSAEMGLNGAVLFMLSTGEEKDLEVVRGWMKTFVENYKKPAEGRETYPWFAGYTGPGFCEYYLRTGDESVLPIIKDTADSLSRTIYNGSWMGRGSANYGYMGGGHLNAAGLHAATFLLMARECGVEVDEHTLQTSLLHVYRFAGHGNVAYGDHLPEGGFTANGKTEGLAFTMQAAANLHPDGEESVYAKARDICGNKAFYNTSWLFHGHTGGGIGELWKGRAMGLVREKRPEPYRSFMDERLWMYELARTHQGVFGWVSDWNVGYTDTGIEGRGWGAYIPLIYTLPRKALRLHGAPPSKYSHTHAIPDLPWGNEADKIFLSLTPGEYLPGKRQDVSGEQLPTDASKPVLARLRDPDVSDEVVLMYAYHFEHGIRAIAAGTINNFKRYQLIPQLLKSSDPRARRTALDAINSSDKKSQGFPEEQFTPEIVRLIGAIIDNPDESWWVTMGALQAMGRATPEQISPHFDRMLAWLDHSDWWLRQAAMQGLTPLASDPDHAKPFLTKVSEVLQTSDRLGDRGPLGGITQELQQASPEIREFAMQVLGESYVKFPEELVEPGGQDLTGNIDLLLENLARDLAQVPGGYDVLYELARKRSPDEALPHEKIFLNADPSNFGPKLRKAIEPTIKNRLIPEYIEANRQNLEREISSRQPGRAIDGLVDLYRKADIHDYDWKLHGPARDAIVWDYITFDPPEKKLWENGHRFREVTVPEGSKDWFTTAFDPKSAPGWKTGRAPFANNDGKPEPVGTCVGEHHFCGCGNPVNTFWDQEALLMRAEIELPPMRDGYAYRLLVGGRSHYNAGGGSDVWIDGDYLPNRRKGLATIQGGSGRNSNVPWGVTIQDEDREHFADGKVLLATNGFLRWGHKIEQIKSYKAFWFEEMKLPELPPAAATE
ncbi:DUF6288 domain-containing protein [Verrucomicrobiaceae bacterium E54]|nr:DUF6288 domain-containing protein [Verrucomicrobiaceae bacterium E54]